MYNEFASLYDELMNDFDYREWFNYIRNILDKYKIEPVRVLEMACGTGNLSYYLAENRYKLTCFDMSDEMLSIAYKKLKTFKNVKILNQNMVDFKFNERYDCVLSICDSMNYILKDEELLSVFKNVYNHLQDNGIFIFDINSSYKLKEIIGNNTFVEDRDNIFYTWENEYDEESNICDFYLTFFYGEDGENFQRADEHHRERAYTTDEIVDMLKLAGFKRVDSYQAFTFEEAGKESERINFVVRK